MIKQKDSTTSPLIGIWKLASFLGLHPVILPLESRAPTTTDLLFATRNCCVLGRVFLGDAP